MARMVPYPLERVGRRRGSRKIQSVGQVDDPARDVEGENKMRLIDADYILSALNVFSDREHGNERFLSGIETAREIVKDAPTIEPKSQWIPVKDRLPEEKQRVLVRCKTVGTTVGWRLWGEWMTDLGDGGSEVTNWMPLPEPYKPAGKEENNETD